MKYKPTIFLTVSFIYYEIIFRIFNKICYFNKNFILIIVFSILLGVVLATTYSIFSKKYHNLLIYLTLFICSILYSLQLCLSNFYGFYFSLSLIHLSDQVKDFSKDAINVVLANGLGIFFLFIPFIVALLFYRKYEYHRLDTKEISINLIIMQISLFIYCLLIFMPYNRFNIYNRVYKNKNMSIKINELGVINSFFIDVYNNVFGHSNAIIAIDNSTEEVVEEKVSYNAIDFDFNKANENTDNDTIKDLNNYFNSQSGSKTNQYTGYFKDKNLIYIMAESFNEIAVNKDLTPTLYKMIHNGFEFNDFYSPTILSTIGGEFMELSGLYADYDVLSIWRNGDNNYPMGLANVFKKEGYSTFAYHDSQYNFQDRNVYLNSIGFDNYLGCGNGLESKMECLMSSWPPYDSDMIDGTIGDYINKNKFMVFYATVSGHGDYGFNSNDTSLNAHVSKVYEDLVRDYYQDQFSDHILAYIAGQIELDRALEKLLDHLQKAGKLDDTVIVLCGDHYPYYLDFNEMSQLAGYQRDYQIECNSSNLIIYNSAMSKISIDKPSGTMDVLPTIYNLFSIEYDSRMIMGKDILSDEEALVIFNNGSWISDYGKYYANEAKFVASKELTIDETTYVNNINDKVNNRMMLTYYIMTNNYYDYIWQFKK